MYLLRSIQLKGVNNYVSKVNAFAAMNVVLGAKPPPPPLSQCTSLRLNSNRFRTEICSEPAKVIEQTPSFLPSDISYCTISNPYHIPRRNYAGFYSEICGTHQTTRGSAKFSSTWLAQPASHNISHLLLRIALHGLRNIVNGSLLRPPFNLPPWVFERIKL